MAKPGKWTCIDCGQNNDPASWQCAKKSCNNTWRKQMQKQADQRRRDRDSATFRNEIAKVLEETMMSTSKYALNHSMYSPPPKSDVAKYR
eukprot:2577652-Pyramimonas_sp.AAC.1